LIHGFGADLSTWMFNQAALAEDRPVYAIDLPGHGGSSKEVADGSPGGLAAVVLAFMDKVGVRTAHLVGHSLGGAIAVEMAGRAPDRVSALTLIAPAGFGTEINGAFIEGFIAEGRPRKLRPVLEMLVADRDGHRRHGRGGVEVQTPRRGGRGVTDGFERQFFRRSAAQLVRERLAGLKVPINVVWGEGDRILPAAHGDGLPPNVRVTRIAGAGHIPHMEKAAEVNAAITAAGLIAGTSNVRKRTNARPQCMCRPGRRIGDTALTAAGLRR
jgi:pyruvate dehydrogenase E2 component (dihydrolipoamide acetyltransferase)